MGARCMWDGKGTPAGLLPEGSNGGVEAGKEERPPGSEDTLASLGLVVGGWGGGGVTEDCDEESLIDNGASLSGDEVDSMVMWDGDVVDVDSGRLWCSDWEEGGRQSR